MLSLRLTTRLRRVLLINALILVLPTMVPILHAQESASPPSQRVVSPAERRMRDRLSRNRSSRSHASNPSPVETDSPAVSSAERRLRAKLIQRRSNPNLRSPVRTQAVGFDAPIRDTLQTPIEPESSVQTAIAIEHRAQTPDDQDVLDVELAPLVELAPMAVQPDSDNAASDPVSLDFFEQLAIQNHPTLNAAISRLLSVRHEALQAGLHPNPRLGLFMDEMGNDNDPGLWGAYLQSNIVRGNKLPLRRNVKNRQACVLELKYEAQLIRIQTDVRVAFYRLLIAQEKRRLAAQLLESQENSVTKSNRLFDGGETPRTDLLQTELQAQKALVLLSRAQVAVHAAWRELATVVGQPDLAIQEVSGSIESIASPVSYEHCLEQILVNSPELQAAKAEVERVRSTVQQQRSQGVPDYQTQIAVGRDANTNHFFAGLQLQVPLQIYDRNQGNIAAAKSNLVAAQSDVESIELKLSKRLAAVYRQYQSASVNAELIKTKLLPNAQQTLDLLSTGYPDEVSFVRLVTAQQTVIDITIEYLTALDQLWSSRLKMEGLLLDDSLE